jgi:hypothetical protein
VVGTLVTITGSNFGQHRGDPAYNYVEFCGDQTITATNYIDWTDTEIDSG